MKEEIKRIKEICEYEDLTREDLAHKTGLTYTRLTNIINERGRVKLEEINQIGEAFPEYKYWLAYGQELPEAGQISPKNKKHSS